MAAVHTAEEGALSVPEKLVSDGSGPGDGASGAKVGAAGSKKKTGSYVPKCGVQPSRLLDLYLLSLSSRTFHVRL